MSKWFLFTRFLFRAVVLYVSMKVYVSITQTSWPSAIMAGKTAISGWPDVHIIRKLHLIYNLSMRFFWTDLKPIFFPPDTNRCYIMILVCVCLSLSHLHILIYIYISIHPSIHPSDYPSTSSTPWHDQHQIPPPTPLQVMCVHHKNFFQSQILFAHYLFSPSPRQRRPLFPPYLFLMKR